MKFDLFSGEEAMREVWQGTLYIGVFDRESIEAGQSFIEREGIKVELRINSTGLDSEHYHVGVRFAAENVLRHQYDRLLVYAKFHQALPLSSSLLLLEHVSEDAAVPYLLSVTARESLAYWGDQIKAVYQQIEERPTRGNGPIG